MKKMRTITISIFVIFISTTVMSCFLDNHTIHVAGDVKKVKKDFSNFTSVCVGSGFDLIIKQDGTESVEIEANENLFQHIIAEQTGGSITFRAQNNTNFSSDRVIRIYVSAKTIEAISGSGGSEIKIIDQLKSKNLAVELSGGSELKAEIECDNLALEVSGGSEVSLTGKSNRFTVSCSGGSEIKAKNLTIENLTAELSGGSVVDVLVNGEVVVEASGGSSVNYTGNGVIKAADLSGGSEINKK